MKVKIFWTELCRQSSEMVGMGYWAIGLDYWFFLFCFDCLQWILLALLTVVVVGRW